MASVIDFNGAKALSTKKEELYKYLATEMKRTRETRFIVLVTSELDATEMLHTLHTDLCNAGFRQDILQYVPNEVLKTKSGSVRFLVVSPREGQTNWYEWLYPMVLYPKFCVSWDLHKGISTRDWRRTLMSKLKQAHHRGGIRGIVCDKMILAY